MTWCLTILARGPVTLRCSFRPFRIIIVSYLTATVSVPAVSASGVIKPNYNADDGNADHEKQNTMNITATQSNEFSSIGWPDFSCHSAGHQRVIIAVTFLRGCFAGVWLQDSNKQTVIYLVLFGLWAAILLDERRCFWWRRSSFVISACNMQCMPASSFYSLFAQGVSWVAATSPAGLPHILTDCHVVYCMCNIKFDHACHAREQQIVFAQ